MRPENRQFLATLFAALIVAASGDAPCNRTAPKWPTSYEVEYSVSYPSTSSFLASAAKIPGRFWISDGARMRYDFSASSGVVDLKQNASWVLTPVINQRICQLTNLHLMNDTEVDPLLPNLRLWAFAGAAVVADPQSSGRQKTVDAFVWQMAATSPRRGMDTGTIEAIDHFYTAQSDGRPLKRTSTIDGRESVTEYTRWVPGPIAEEVFYWPRECVQASLDWQALQSSQANATTKPPYLQPYISVQLPETGVSLLPSSGGGVMGPSSTPMLPTAPAAPPPPHAPPFPPANPSLPTFPSFPPGFTVPPPLPPAPPGGYSPPPNSTGDTTPIYLQVLIGIGAAVGLPIVAYGTSWAANWLVNQLCKRIKSCASTLNSPDADGTVAQDLEKVAQADLPDVQPGTYSIRPWDGTTADAIRYDLERAAMNGELDLPDEGSDVDPNDVAGGGVNGNPQDPDGEPDAEPVDDPVDIPLVEAALESYAPFFPTQVAVRSNSTGRRPTFRDVNIATNSRIIYTYNSLATNASSRRHGRPSYFMAPNAFVGSSIAEWYLGAAGSRPQNHSTLAVYSRVLTTSQLPASLDYRGTAADGPGVKDQLGCNGCWAFTAVGALQGAWAKATGTPLSFSEQQLLDCAWGNGNMGCSQGDPISALLYVVGGSRGIAEEGMYPYEGVGGFCRLTRSKPPLVGRFSRVVMLPAGDDAALMEALVRFGPLSVIMQVMPSFMFYSSGVYYDSSCNGTLGTGGQLYHSVVLMGYGTTADGVDYWIIKNSWGTTWGLNGYGLVARAHNGTDCGINQYAAFVEVAPKAVAAAAAVGVGRRLLLG